MNNSERQMVSRREIMNLAAISSPLVSKWKERHFDFPQPRLSDQGEFYVLAEMIEWLRGRPIPAKSRLSDYEPPGTTYADRIVRKLRNLPPFPIDPPAPSNVVARMDTDHVNQLADLFGAVATRISGGDASTEYLQLVLGSVFVCDRDSANWKEIGRLVGTAAARPETKPAELLAAVAVVIDRVLRAHGVLPGLGPVFARLRPTSVKDVAQVLRACDGLDRRSFPALLDRFASWSPRKSNEFVTPAALVELVTEIVIDSAAGDFHCHDPYMRSGEFASSAAARAADATVSGVGRDSTQERLAGMSSAIHGADVSRLNRSVAAPLVSSANWPIGVDFVVTNPPFNQKTTGQWREPDGGWPFGTPPRKNGNFAWLQRVYASLTPGSGRAGVVMPNQAGTSEDREELAIRTAMIDAGAVECVIALPAGLFATTPVPVSIWILSRPSEVRDSVLLIDARSVGDKQGGRRYLSERDVSTIVDCHRAWILGGLRGDPLDFGGGNIAFAVGHDEIARCGYSLSPADYRVIPGVPTAARTVPLAELCDLRAGPSNDIVKTLDLVEGGVPLIAPAQLLHRRVVADQARRISHAAADRLGRFQVRPLDILCARTGTLGPCAIIDSDDELMLFSTALIRLRVKDKVDVIDPRYLLAFLSLPSTVAWIENKAAGTSIPSISSANLGKLLVPLPPLAEQRRIGDQLATTDEQIVRLHRKVQDLNKLRVDLAVTLFANLPSG
ncbi:N-6 DNA methylase [Nocardia sp. NPDC003693]